MSTCQLDDLRRELRTLTLQGVDERDSRKLGNGSFGVVKTVLYEGQEYACKTFHEYLLGPNSAERTMTALLLECRSALDMNHDNIVLSYGLYWPAEAIFPSIVMECLPYCLGTLLSEGEVLSELKPFILADVAKGLAYLHFRGIMHRDLTANNILLTDTWDAKITDFGQAKVINWETVREQTAVPGNPTYMPPEAKQGTGLQTYDFSLDIFSFGVLILHILIEKIPRILNEQVKNKDGQTILLPPLDYFKEDIDQAVLQDETFRSLLERCLEESPSRRPSTEELVIETGDIERIKFSLFKKNYIQMIAREKETTVKTTQLEDENKILWEQLQKFNDIVSKSKAFRAKQQEGLRKSFKSDTGKGEQRRSYHDSETRGASNNGRSSSPLLVSRTSRQYSTEDEASDEDNLMLSIRDVRLGQDANTEVLERQLEQANLDHSQMREECERLREENHRLQDEIRLLRGSPDGEQLSLSSSLQQTTTDLDPPPTITNAMGPKRLLEDDVYVTIQDVPQESLSFNDVRGAHAVFCQGKIYVGRATNSVWMYDTIRKHWRNIKNNAPVKNFGLAVYKDRLVLVGGLISEGKFSSDIRVLTDDEKWEVAKQDFIKPMPRARENPAVAVSGQDLIVMGGTSTTLFGAVLQTLNSIDIFNGKDWVHSRVTLDRAADDMQCFIQSGYLYMLNSDGWKIRYCNVTALINSTSKKVTDLWKYVPRDIPHAHSCIFVYDHTLLAISGTSSDGLLYAYDPSRSQWQRVACTDKILPAIRNATCLPIGNNQLFLCGGYIDMFTNSTKLSFILTVGRCPSLSCDDMNSMSSPSDSTDYINIESNGVATESQNTET